MAAKNNRIMYTLEYPVRCSPNILFEFLSTPLGLSEWFADKVDQKEKSFTFYWNGSGDHAEMVEQIDNNYIRFRWDYYDENEFFELRTEQSDVTSETILKITDFAEKGDIDDQEQLWNSQVETLKHRIGS